MFNPNPWTKGFSPPSKCPVCKRLYTLSFIGKRDQMGNHIYHCSVCGKFVGAPTDYAECKFYGITIEKDVFWSPCKDCPHREPVPGSGVCKYFNKEWYGETPVEPIITKTVEKVTIPGWGKRGELSEAEINERIIDNVLRRMEIEDKKWKIIDKKVSEERKKRGFKPE